MVTAIPMRLIVSLIAVAAACCSAATQPIRFAKIVTEGDTISLAGDLENVPAYGPPVFGETPEHDWREDYIALVGFSPIEGRWRDGTLEEKTTTRAQLTFAWGDSGHTNNAKKLQALILSALSKKQKVKITGEVTIAINGHHHEPILIEVHSVEIAESTPKN